MASSQDMLMNIRSEIEYLIQSKIDAIEALIFESKVNTFELYDRVESLEENFPERSDLTEETNATSFPYWYAYNKDGTEFDVQTDSAKPWVLYDSNTDAFSEEIGPPPTPWPPHQIWFRKAGTTGDIVIKRFG